MITVEEEEELKQLEIELELNDKEHARITFRIAQLLKKKLGQAYRFQNSHEAT